MVANLLGCIVSSKHEYGQWSCSFKCYICVVVLYIYCFFCWFYLVGLLVLLLLFLSFTLARLDICGVQSDRIKSVSFVPQPHRQFNFSSVQFQVHYNRTHFFPFYTHRSSGFLFPSFLPSTNSSIRNNIRVYFLSLSHLFPHKLKRKPTSKLSVNL